MGGNDDHYIKDVKSQNFYIHFHYFMFFELGSNLWKKLSYPVALSPFYLSLHVTYQRKKIERMMNATRWRSTFPYLSHNMSFVPSFDLKTHYPRNPLTLPSNMYREGKTNKQKNALGPISLCFSKFDFYMQFLRNFQPNQQRMKI